MPILQASGLMIPGQLGPIRRVLFDMLSAALTLTMSCSAPATRQARCTPTYKDSMGLVKTVVVVTVVVFIVVIIVVAAAERPCLAPVHASSGKFDMQKE